MVREKGGGGSELFNDLGELEFSRHWSGPPRSERTESVTLTTDSSRGEKKAWKCWLVLGEH